jgi:hypothetical protein
MYIDCGLNSAVAILADDGTLVSVHDTPTLTLRTDRGRKTRSPAWWRSSRPRLL